MKHFTGDVAEGDGVVFAAGALAVVDGFEERIAGKVHGHVKAVPGTMRKIGLHNLIAATRSRQRDRVLAMAAERLIHGCSKLACTRDECRSTHIDRNADQAGGP